MISKISLENWKTHLNTEFTFEKGTNVIVGKMGSGKSSIMDAISFALYGTFPNLIARKVNMDETIMAKPMKKETAKVKIEFNYNNKNYSAERIVKRNGINEAYLREEGTLIAGPKTTDVTKKITEITETNYELFSRAIYSEQNQVDFFMKLSPAQRKEKFDELLGLNKYEKVRTNSVTIMNRIKKANEDRKNFLQEQKKKADPKKIEEYEKKFSEKKKELEEKTLLKEAMEKELKIDSEKLERYEKKAETFRKLREKEIENKSRLKSIEEQIKKLAEKTGDTKKLKEKKETLENELTKIKNELEKIREENKEAEKILIGEKEKLAVLKNRAKENEESFKNAEKLQAECPVCKRPMEEHDKHKLKEDLKTAEEKISTEMKTAEEAVKKGTDHVESGKKKESEKEKEQEQKRKLIEETERLLESEKELTEIGKLKEEKEKEIAEVLKEISEIGFNEKETEEMKKIVQEKKEKLAGIKSEESSGKELLKEIESNLKTLKEIEENIGKLQDQVLNNEKAAEKMAIFTAALKSTQEELRTTLVKTINEAMEEIWQKTYPYKDITSAKMQATGGSYEIIVKQLNGDWVRAEGILSGGERTAVALTLRLAVSLVLTRNLGWIILDEPTHNLDTTTVRELSETMRNQMPQLIEQIFIITHDKEMENAACGKIYNLEREKEKDGPTKIADNEISV